MDRREYIDTVSKAAALQYDLWRKFPQYVHLDLILSTNQDGTEGIKYNIYTPEINHNHYTDFRDFVKFLDRLIKDGVVRVRIQVLEDRLTKAQTKRVDAVDVIHETQKELAKLKEE